MVKENPRLLATGGRVHLPLIRQAGSAEAFVGSAATGREQFLLPQCSMIFKFFLVDRILGAGGKGCP